MQLLSKNSIDFVDKNVEMLNMALIRRPVGFSEEIIAVFKMKNLKLTPKMTKIPKFSIFKVFTHFSIFRQNFDRLRVLECFKGSTRKVLVVR